jgi:CRP-like cAMP-binding protein
MVEINQLTDGSGFGEISLMTNKLRSTTITCLTECLCLIFHKKEYLRYLVSVHEKELDVKILFLNSLPQFKTLTRTVLTRIAYHLKEKTLIKGQVIFQEGDFPSTVYIVKEGEIEVYTKLKQDYSEVQK